jgi:hypothetical protein
LLIFSSLYRGCDQEAEESTLPTSIKIYRQYHNTINKTPTQNLSKIKEACRIFLRWMSLLNPDRCQNGESDSYLAQGGPVGIGEWVTTQGINAWPCVTEMTVCDHIKLIIL